MLSLVFKALIAPITCCINIAELSCCGGVGYGTCTAGGLVDEALGYAVVGVGVGFAGSCGWVVAVRRFRVGTAGSGVEPGIVTLARADRGTADCSATLLQ